MRRTVLIVVVGLLALLGLAAQASAATITNGTVSLGVNPSGSLNDAATGVGVAFNGNDGTFPGCPCEGWGAGAGGATLFQGAANEDAGDVGFTQGPFTATASTALSVVDILRSETPALRLTQDFHPSPTTPNLYEITVTLENISGGPLTDVRYERVMDWDIEPTPSDEFVTINRGPTPPAALLYSDDNGFANGLPFNTPEAQDPATVDADYVDKGPDDHGARFRFGFGDLAAGEKTEFFLYYGATADEASANAAVSAAALEVFSYGQPNTEGGATLGTPNTFIWGFRGVGGTAAIPPTLSLTPEAASSDVGGTHSLTATLTGSGGAPVPGAQIVFGVAGANAAAGTGTTDGNGQAGFNYAGSTAGDDTITACLDADNSGTCDAGEVTDTATKHWDARPVIEDRPLPVPTPEVGKTVVVNVVSGTIRIKGKNGKFHTLKADESIPVGSTIDATKGKVRLTSAANKSGATQSAVFYRGQFAVTQTKGAKPITQLALNAKLSCATRKGKKAGTSAKRKKVRRLWGDGKGRFRTKGRHGAATVKGTKWLTEDRCGRTLVRVKRGKVTVRDFVKRKTVTVKQGRVYVARAKQK